VREYTAKKIESAAMRAGQDVSAFLKDFVARSLASETVLRRSRSQG
jgi:hypothetical protein